MADNLSQLPGWTCSSLATENERAGAALGGSSFLSMVMSKRKKYIRAQLAHPMLVSIFPVLKCKGCFQVHGNGLLRQLLKSDVVLSYVRLKHSNITCEINANHSKVLQVLKPFGFA